MNSNNSDSHSFIADPVRIPLYISKVDTNPGSVDLLVDLAR